MNNPERWKQRYYNQKTELKRLNRQIEVYRNMVDSAISQKMHWQDELNKARQSMDYFKINKCRCWVCRVFG